MARQVFALDTARKLKGHRKIDFLASLCHKPQKASAAQRTVLPLRAAFHYTLKSRYMWQPQV